MTRTVKIQLTQPHQDADGNVLHQPGELFDEGDKLLKDLPPGSFKAVIVDDDDTAKGTGLSTEEKGTTPEGWAVDKDGVPADRPDYLIPEKADKADKDKADKPNPPVKAAPGKA